ncbi:MAG: ZIP family metal transporter [archaeon]
MNWFFNSMVAVILISLISLIGVFFLGINVKKMEKILLFLVSFSVGALFGDAFIHLIPEAFSEIGFGLKVPLFILFGILLFFVLEKFIKWRHCHAPTSKEHKHPVGMMNLVGEGMHNLLDGLLIGASFMVDFRIGIATTVAVILHEIPQEIGDFGILVHAGYSKGKALFYNFLSALTAILGVVIVCIVGSGVENFAMYLLPITAGGFIYIAGSDLVPELHKDCSSPRISVLQFLALILGILIMAGLAYVA